MKLCEEHSGYTDVPYVTGTEDLTVNYRRNTGVHTLQEQGLGHARRHTHIHKSVKEQRAGGRGDGGHIFSTVHTISPYKAYLVPALGAPQLLIRDHIEIIPNRKETVGEAQR